MSSENVERYNNYFKSLQDKNTTELFDNLKKMKVSDQQDAHIYLIEKVMPTVFSGIEDLSKEVEKLQKRNDIKQEIRDRFNPCIYLAQYLMRNNPKYASQNEQLAYNNNIQKQRTIQYIKENYDQLLSQFQTLTNCSKNNCTYQQATVYFQEIDQFYNQNGKMNDFFIENQSLQKLNLSNSRVNFDEILAVMMEYGYICKFI